MILLWPHTHTHTIKPQLLTAGRPCPSVFPQRCGTVCVWTGGVRVEEQVMLEAALRCRCCCWCCWCWCCGGGEQRGAAGDKVDAWRRLFSAAAGSLTPWIRAHSLCVPERAAAAAAAPTADGAATRGRVASLRESRLFGGELVMPFMGVRKFLNPRGGGRRSAAHHTWVDG